MKNAKHLGVAFVCLLTALLATALEAAEPFYEGLGSHTRAVTTQSPEAQKYFDQGLRFLQGFNHGAAIRSFEEAARIDHSLAMAHWGIALALGPHINAPQVPPAAAERAWKELKLAQQHAQSASPVERDLIGALAHRYADPPPEDRAALDQAYADAMRKVWQKYPADADVGVFLAESLLDLRPWDQWTPEGQPQPGTEEVIAVLDAVLKINLQHPLANHLYIHTLEASPNPERAMPAANRLRDLQPGLAHNVHMPSHIDVRCGQWQQAVVSNQKAVEADRKYREVAGPAKGFLNVYIAHNQHMLAYAAMMNGQSELALKHIQVMVDGLPEEFVKEHAILAEGWVAMPYEVLMRFGRWDEILAEPDRSKDYMPFTRAFRHASRAVAHAAKGDTAQAREEQKLYLAASEKIPADEYLAGNNLAQTVCQVVTPMLEGEILVSEGKMDEGLAQLRQAIAVEDTLKYDEPPAWMIPVRHTLGATLMQAGRFAEAEQVYREDLKRLPNNGWSLYGLSQSLRRQDKTKQANAVQADFDKVWANADTKIDSSCLCRRGDSASQ